MSKWKDNFYERFGGKTCREIKEIGQWVKAKEEANKILRENKEKYNRSKAKKLIENYLKEVL